jgi:hypothetical protein
MEQGVGSSAVNQFTSLVVLLCHLEGPIVLAQRKAQFVVLILSLEKLE